MDEMGTSWGNHEDNMGEIWGKYGKEVETKLVVLRGIQKNCRFVPSVSGFWASHLYFHEGFVFFIVFIFFPVKASA